MPMSSFAQRVDFFAQPQPQIERDLIVAAAAGVDFIRQLAGVLLELADHQRVHVFVGGVVEESRLARLGADLLESFHQLRAFFAS